MRKVWKLMDGPQVVDKEVLKWATGGGVSYKANQVFADRKGM